MNFDFDKTYRTTRDALKDHATSVKQKHKGNSGVPLRVLKRQDDKSRAHETWDVMNKSIGYSRILKAVQIILRWSETVNHVLMKIGPISGIRRSSVRGKEKQQQSRSIYENNGYGTIFEDRKDEKKNGITAGTPAIYLKFAETIAEREKKLSDEEKTLAEKARLVAERKKKKEEEAAACLAKREERARRKAERAKPKPAKTAHKKNKACSTRLENGSKTQENQLHRQKKVPISSVAGTERSPLETLADAAVSERDNRKIRRSK